MDAKFISDDAIETLKKELLPIGNGNHTKYSGSRSFMRIMKIANEEEMIIAAEKISLRRFGCAVLCKGWSSTSMMPMIYCIEMTNIHGLREKGLTTQIHMEQDVHFPVLSHQILPRDMILRDICKRAKDYISGALEAMLDLGKG